MRNPDSNKLPIDIEKLTDPAVMEEARAYEKELVAHNTWRANHSAKLEALVAKATKDIKDNHKDGPPSKRAATGADKDEATGGACAAARMDTEDRESQFRFYCPYGQYNPLGSLIFNTEGGTIR